MATLGTLITATTYGTWLRGDARGWVDDGVIMPPSIEMELADYERLKHPPYRFQREQLLNMGQRICATLSTRLKLRLLALTVQTWHIHFVLPATTIELAEIVKCAKETVRFGLKPSQPIWTEGYDKRFCFDWERLLERVQYVERHNEREGWPRQPWPELLSFEAYMKSFI